LGLRIKEIIVFGCRVSGVRFQVSGKKESKAEGGKHRAKIVVD
jgi:hypothetical protein